MHPSILSLAFPTRPRIPARRTQSPWSRSVLAAAAVLVILQPVQADAQGPRVIARWGDPVPDVPGATYTALMHSKILDGPQINDSGQVVFRA